MLDTEGDSILIIATEFLPAKWCKYFIFKCLRKKTNFNVYHSTPCPPHLSAERGQMQFFSDSNGASKTCFYFFKKKNRWFLKVKNIFGVTCKV